MEHVLAVLDEAMLVHSAISAKVRLAIGTSPFLELFAQRGLSERFTRMFAQIRNDDAAPSAIAFSTRRRVRVGDTTQDASAALYREASVDEGFRAMQSTPIFGAGGRVIGALSTHFARVPSWSAADNLVLDYCATKLARVLDERFHRR